MRAGENVEFSSISATTAAFTLRGGEYGVDCVGTGYGMVTLNKRGADGSTFVSTGVSFAANGYQTTYLPPGTYEVVISGATVSVNLQRVPGE